MPHVLLLGAGFSRNWGGWLADEAFEYLLGHPRIDDGLRTLLWKHRREGGGFEAALNELQTETVEHFTTPLLDQATRLGEAIRGMFADMNTAFAERGTFNFVLTGPGNSVNDFLAQFDAIFTLNQDLLVEHLYLADHLSMLLQPKDWYMPGMEPTTEPPTTAIRDVKEWRPMDPADLSKSTVDRNRQPFFKLHGSSNWIDRSGTRPMLVIGGNKPSAIARHPILRWNHEQFREYLSKPATRLMVIGYSFFDAHINDAIGSAVDRGSLKLFIIDPDGVDVLDKDYRWTLFWPDSTVRGPLFNRLQDHLIGASRRSLRETFGEDLVEHRKVMKFFLESSERVGE